MSWRSIVNRAVRIGVREGMRYLKESQSRGDSSREDGRGRPAPGPSRGGQRTGGQPQGQRSGGQPSGGQRSGGQSAHVGPTSARETHARRSGGADYPGDYHGPVTVTYSPDLDGDADPGEVVWGWVPFEEDHAQGKDRPSLVIGHDGEWVLVLMLTSKDHIPGGIGEVRSDGGARWMNIGSGEWDGQGRPSEIRLDRIIRLDPTGVRREGAVLPREVFALVAAEFDGR